MKIIKSLLFIFLIFLITDSAVFAQGKSIVLGSGHGNPSYYVGSMPKTNSGVYEKLKVEVFGGNWHNTTLGENTFYISSRDGLKKNQELRGGSPSHYALKIYDNGSSYDIVVQITGDWPSLSVRSWKVWGAGVTNLQEVNVTEYSTSGKTDVTSQFPPTILIASTNSGNVGIGTLNPGSFKLAVEGKIGAREVKVQSSGWADFVFAEDYVLPPLAEVEQFIKENKHLPEVPSEAEVKENGIELGKMDALLLQKIEELTLYMIELKKENEEQAKQIQELRRQNEKLLRMVEN